MAREHLIILAGIIAAMHQGKLPPAIPALEAALSISLIEAGFLLSLVQLAGMTVGLFMGLAADKIGLRKSLLTGLIIIMLASFAGGFSTHVATLLVCRAMEGLGFLLIVLPAPGLIRRLVAPQLLSRRLGLWGCYMGFGTGFALLLGPWFIEHFGWANWWWLLSVLTLVVTVLIVQKIPPDPVEQTAHSTPEHGWQSRLQLTLKAPGPWLIAIIFAMYSSQWLSVVGFLPTLYAQAGFSGGMVGVLTASVALINVTGNFGGGQLLHRGVLPQHLLFGGFTIMAMGSVLTFGSATESWPVLRFVAVLCFSAVGGMIPAALFSLAMQVAPSENTVSTTVGWMQQWSSFGQFAGPPLVAAVAVGVGGWQWTWAVTGSAALVGILLARVLSARLA
ncbi:MAG: MFS transporter [Saccharospirillum sp.]|nr:MFS transporter [Saccharospirillum sp.]